MKTLRAKLFPFYRGVAALALGIGLLGAVWAQNGAATGTLTGRVLDAAGATVPGARITATEIATGIVIQTRSDAAGFYSFPLMSVGTYRLTIAKAGFKTTAMAHVVVQIGQTSEENTRLEVGAVTQQVTVTSQAPLLRATQTTVSTVVNRQLIKSLPLSGRRYTDFVLLTPNANSDGEFGLVSFGGQQGGGDSGYANGNGANSFTVMAPPAATR